MVQPLCTTPTADLSAGNDITLRQFTDFCCAKAFDIISDNRYRKFLVRSRDMGDSWAISMQSSVAAVQGRIRKIQQLVAVLSEVQSHSLERVCKEVLGSMTPPVKVRDEWNVCCITGARSQGCIEVSRSQPDRSWLTSCKLAAAAAPGPGPGPAEAAATHPGIGAAASACRGSGGTDMAVHPRFGHFLLMLWFVCKIEHVVRNYTRCWLECRVSSQPRETSVMSLCDEFSQQHAFLDRMHAIFSHGCDHVRRSLGQHMQLARDRARTGADAGVP